jgi:hypothetical protein
MSVLESGEIRKFAMVVVTYLVKAANLLDTAQIAYVITRPRAGGVEGAHTKQGRAHIRRLPDWAARPALIPRAAHAVESKAVGRIEVAVPLDHEEGGSAGALQGRAAPPIGPRARLQFAGWHTPSKAMRGGRIEVTARSTPSSARPCICIESYRFPRSCGGRPPSPQFWGGAEPPPCS